MKQVSIESHMHGQLSVITRWRGIHGNTVPFEVLTCYTLQIDL